jgi:hypothetical protein
MGRNSKRSYHVNTMAEQAICHSNVGKNQMQNVTSAINLDMKLLFVKANFKNKKHMLKLLIKMKKIRYL